MWLNDQASTGDTYHGAFNSQRPSNLVDLRPVECQQLLDPAPQPRQGIYDVNEIETSCVL
jgi:hypothetical protein